MANPRPRLTLDTLWDQFTRLASDIRAVRRLYVPRSSLKNFAAACTANVNVNAVAQVDITGATVTFTTNTDGAYLLVTTVFDCLQTVVGTGVLQGALTINGVDQTGLATFNGPLNGRACSCQSYAVTLGAAGSYTVKLRAAISAASGTIQVRLTHTSFTATLFDY